MTNDRNNNRIFEGNIVFWKEIYLHPQHNCTYQKNIFGKVLEVNYTNCLIEYKNGLSAITKQVYKFNDDVYVVGVDFDHQNMNIIIKEDYKVNDIKQFNLHYNKFNIFNQQVRTS